MSDSDPKSVRRFGKQNRKNEIKHSGSLFPVDDDSTRENQTQSLDLDQLALPDRDAEALQSLSALQGEVKSPIITPEAERYPPLAPSIPSEPTEPIQAIAHQHQHDIELEKKVRRYNRITFFMVTGTILMSIWFALVWVDPQGLWNPLPPPTPYLIVTATPQGFVESIPPTPDADGNIFVVITDTPAPVIASTDSPYPFIINQPILYAPNTNSLGCNWWSIAGAVTDQTGSALNGYRIRVTGDGVDETVFSGAAITFGAGGFELPLIGTPQASTFDIQLFSPQDAPLSEAFSITTRADCDGNVTIVNFIQNR